MDILCRDFNECKKHLDILFSEGYKWYTDSLFTFKENFTKYLLGKSYMKDVLEGRTNFYIVINKRKKTIKYAFYKKRINN